MLNRLNSILNSISSIFHQTGTVLVLPCITGLVTLDVFMRYVMNSPIHGSKEINGLMLVIVFFFSFTRCWDKGRHVRVDLLYSRMKEKARLCTDCITGIAGMMFSGLLSFQLIRDLPYVITTRESGEELGILFWPFKILIALCCILLFLSMLIYFIDSLKTFLRSGK